MNFKYIAFVAYVTAMLLLPSCVSHNENGHDHHEHEYNHKHNHEHSHDHDHVRCEEHDNDDDDEQVLSDVIVFAPERAAKYGVVTMLAKRTQLSSAIRVSGEIQSAPGESYTVAAPSSGIVKIAKGISQGSHVGAGVGICTVSAKNMTGGDANEQAKIDYEAAKRELERLKPLYEDKIVTQREYNAALQVYETAKNAYLPNSQQAVLARTSIAGVITDLFVVDGQYVEAGAPIAEINRNSRIVLRADLPERLKSTYSTIKTANVVLADGTIVSMAALNGKRVSSPVAMTVKSGYLPVYFEVDNDGSLSVGSFVEIYLISESENYGIQLPVESVVEELGNYYVYVRLDDDCYDKRKVELGASDGKIVQLLHGLNEGEDVVVKGSTYIRLAGNSSAIPDGCEHHHH